MDQSSASGVNWYRCTTLASILTAALLTAGSTASTLAQEQPLPLDLNGSFSTLYEPSGIVPLSDERFLIVEDEAKRALRLATLGFSAGSDSSFFDESRLELPAGFAERLSVGVLDDLEGAAHDQSGRLYVVSSHDDSAPYWASKRQKLLRFSIQDGRMHDVAIRLTLRRDLLLSYPQLKSDHQGKDKKKTIDMNIEGLAYDRRRDVLLIGFRTPVLDGEALIVRLLNPDAYLARDAPPELDESLWSVDLDKGGLRAMTYDDQSDQLLLVSRRENHKDDSYKLWRLAADGREPAVRIRIGDQEDMLENVEGLAPISVGQHSNAGLLLVRDDGNEKKGQGGKWFILSRGQIGLEPVLH